MPRKRKFADGTIVWVNMGDLWWPAEVYGYDRMPDMLKPMKKFAVVKFFQKAHTMIVQQRSDITWYQCARKMEFITFGMGLIRTGLYPGVHFFAKDVRTAEWRTSGVPDIIYREEFGFEKIDSDTIDEDSSSDEESTSDSDITAVEASSTPVASKSNEDADEDSYTEASKSNSDTTADEESYTDASKSNSDTTADEESYTDAFESNSDTTADDSSSTEASPRPRKYSKVMKPSSHRRN